MTQILIQCDSCQLIQDNSAKIKQTLLITTKREVNEGGMNDNSSIIKKTTRLPSSAHYLESSETIRQALSIIEGDDIVRSHTRV